MGIYGFMELEAVFIFAPNWVLRCVYGDVEA